MAFVYLIGEEANEGNFKIGVTTEKTIEKRMKKLQTGNSNKLIIRKYYETDKPFKLETMLHNFYKNKNILNEWFYLTNEEVEQFISVCDKYEKIMICLKNNYFFNKKKIINQGFS